MLEICTEPEPHLHNKTTEFQYHGAAPRTGCGGAVPRAACPALAAARLRSRKNKEGGVEGQVSLLSRAITAEEYNAAAARAPEECPLLAAGDLRTGRQVRGARCSRAGGGQGPGHDPGATDVGCSRAGGADARGDAG